MHIVLLEPEIPQNTGNIARTCAATGISLDIIHPAMFSLSEKQVKRAGLDYWHLLDIKEHDNFEAFFAYYKNPKLVMVTTKAKKLYSDFVYDDNCFLMFGKESKGIPENMLKQYKESCVRIPMINEARSLNLSNAVSIVLYEALRQNGFMNLLLQGELHNDSWD